jgi:hypothetical protein
MLQHLRSTALKSFKTRLEKTVKEKQGDGFEESVDNCGWSKFVPVILSRVDV